MNKEELRHKFKTLVHVAITYSVKYWVLLSVKLLKFAYYPFYLYCKRKGYLFAINLTNGVGHIFPEMDSLFRSLYAKNIATTKCTVILIPGDLAPGINSFYHSKFKTIIHTWKKFAFVLPLPIAFPSLALDVGQSRLKWYLTDPKNREIRRFSSASAISQLASCADGVDQYNHFYQLREKTSGVNFLRNNAHEATENLRKLLNLPPNAKVCVIQIKDAVMNATGAVTDPSTYVKSIQKLQSLGYSIVFSGREKMPEIFHSLNVIEYAQTPFANFTNDIALFHLADMALIAGSGLSFLADCLEIPFLYLNAWHIANVPFLKHCVCVPAVIREKASQNLLNFQEQIDLFEKNEKEVDVLDQESYETINASEEDIYLALEELLNGISKRSPEQSFFHTKYRSHGFMRFSESRISLNFLKKYSGLV